MSSLLQLPILFKKRDVMRTKTSGRGGMSGKQILTDEHVFKTRVIVSSTSLGKFIKPHFL